MIMGPFTKYITCLIQLHELNRKDSVEADDVRDQMDEPWQAMSKEQQLLCSSVSVALIKERDE